MTGRIPPGVKPIRRLPSRKNSVYLVERNGSTVILKVYDNDRWENEVSTLRLAKAKDIPVPEVIDAADGMVFLEYIKGETVNDIVDRGDSHEAVYAVCSWLARFHKAFYHDGRVLVKSDAIFKNFIMAGRVYGLDFELSHEGFAEEDMGEMLAYILDTEPMFTDDKIKLCRSLVSFYEEKSGIRLPAVDEYVAKALIEASAFRPRHAALLIKKAGEIRRQKPLGT